MTLDELKINENAVITAVRGDGTARRRLIDMGLLPGTTVSVCKYAPTGDPMEIKIRSYLLTLRRSHARMIEVKPCRM